MEGPSIVILVEEAGRVPELMLCEI